MGERTSHRMRARREGRGLRVAAIAAALAVTVAVAAYVLVGATVRTRGGPVPVPATGVYFGAWTSPNTGHTLAAREAQIGRRYKLVHLYHDWNDRFPTRQERAWARGGRILFFDWTSRIFGTRRVVAWSAIAAGREDRTIDSAAARIRAIRSPVLMSFFAEPEEAVGTFGSAHGFADAFRHIRRRFRAAGATNVAWVWNVSGNPADRRMYGLGLYPGDDAVDWIAWDPYNWYLCHRSGWRSFVETVSPFYAWLIANGHGNKPFMLAEYGSRESDVDRLAKGRWFGDGLAALKGGAFPNLKALVYFDSNRAGECDWRIDTSPASLDGFRKLGADPYLNPGRRPRVRPAAGPSEAGGGSRS